MAKIYGYSRISTNKQSITRQNRNILDSYPNAEIKQEVLDSGRVVYHRKITQLGREFILSLFENVA